MLEARKAGDAELVTLIRILIAAIDNAEAVDASTVGPGVTEAARRHLSDGAIMQIVLGEGDDLRAAAADYAGAGRADEAERLRSLALVADRYADAIGGSADRRSEGEEHRSDELHA